MIILTRLAMVTPTAACIYAPSRLTPPRQMTEAEFLSDFADNPRAILVSFAPDGKSDPQLITAYTGNGFDCWWMVSETQSKSEAGR